MLDHAPDLDKLVADARDRFREVFGHQATWVVAAPGRVNLIGEHTDYNDGFVLPMAIERHVVIAAARPSGESAGADPGTAVVDAYSDLIGERESFLVDGSGKRVLPAWCVYIHGVLDLLHRRGQAAGPLELVVLSTVPLGGGLSSSAALEVATATLVEAVSDQPLGGREKAKLCQQVENEYVGVPCGIMDPFSSAMCREGEAMRLDCRSLETAAVPLGDPDLAVLIINSNVKHDLGSSEYPLRRAQCEAAAAKLGASSLRDVSPEGLEAARSNLEAVEHRRARHVLTENKRVEAFAAAAAAGDWPAAGQQMYASHASLRDDFEVTCPELDVLVELASVAGVSGGVYGSRMTGGGFGGCTVSLVDASAAESVASSIAAPYLAATGIEAAAFVSRPAAGARSLTR